ncbi:MAG: topoisomerase C-terminal repeat-containing protein [Clostridia bacterium]|nr:topoisomerase C-terminal repeat-containing protein [Clostridia bacterium]
MKLIIAEKPSLGRNIVAAIGDMHGKNGYYEGNEYIVTWAFGHLFSLADIEDYKPLPDGVKHWCLDNIPCFPDDFKFVLKRNPDKTNDAGIEKQFNTIKYLCNRPDVDTIINAGDSDREGEIIVRICIAKALESPKRLTRLWLPDQTADTIIDGLFTMKDESYYDNLANEGLARTYIDWLYGVNLTRYATLKCGTLLRVGRVIVPIVKAIYDRDMAIRNFVPETYYGIQSNEKTNDEEIELLSKEKFAKEKLVDAENLCKKYNDAGAVVKSVKKKVETVSPGKLYSLTKLQNHLGKKYKMPMEKSLAILQKLYEEGYVSYPRTNSEYLATNEKSRIKSLLDVIGKMGYPVEFKDKKTIFDDKKIESHSALTPTMVIPDKKKLSEDEMKVYSAVFRRFVAVFCAQECVVNRSEITISVGEYEDFVLKGVVMIDKGWTKYDDYTKKDKVLPALKKGDSVNIDFKTVEKETTPPKHYTIETLNNYLKNPFKDDKNNIDSESDEEEYRAIFEGLELGTEATRTGIIDNARKSGYIELKKDVYHILPGGEYLIESLTMMNISMDKYKTSELGKALKRVYRDEMTIEESVELAKKEISSVFEKRSLPPEQDNDFGFYGDVAGKCPLCGKDVVRTRFGYGCTGYKESGCKFTVNSKICGRVISLANMKKLLSDGETYKINGFISKNNKNFDATLYLEDGKVKFKF